MAPPGRVPAPGLAGHGAGRGGAGDRPRRGARRTGRGCRCEPSREAMTRVSRNVKGLPTTRSFQPALFLRPEAETTRPKNGRPTGHVAVFFPFGLAVLAVLRCILPARSS